MKKINLKGDGMDACQWIHRGYTVTLTPEPCKVSAGEVTTNQYEIWGPDADGTTFIAQARTLLEARETIEADLTRLSSKDFGSGHWA